MPALMKKTKIRTIEKYVIGKSTFRIQEYEVFDLNSSLGRRMSWTYYRVHEQWISAHKGRSQFIVEDMETLGGARTAILNFLSRKPTRKGTGK